ncbi:MAG: serine dehydrogenasease [Candidatus Berkelbacteria bacterium]|nr:serine dehydrogenasease [Candidatus Berkelbacteria bacterium]
METVERIVSIFRKHYRIVEFVVPNYAYSAGTILVMSGDEIHMDYYSVLGPIDPQYEFQGEYVPGLGYLAKYEELTAEINNCDPTQLNEVQAQLSFLVNKFDPAKLFHIEQSIEHAKSLLKEWLPKYKFKDWKKTGTNGTKVTKSMKDKRANEIAEVLGNAKRWHSHGRGISIRELGSEEIKLKINNFGDDTETNGLIRAYYGLFVDYIQKIGMDSAIHSNRGLKRAA